MATCNPLSQQADMFEDDEDEEGGFDDQMGGKRGSWQIMQVQ